MRRVLRFWQQKNQSSLFTMTPCEIGLEVLTKSETLFLPHGVINGLMLPFFVAFSDQAGKSGLGVTFLEFSFDRTTDLSLEEVPL